jgi:hypothetical protein
VDESDYLLQAIPTPQNTYLGSTAFTFASRNR